MWSSVPWKCNYNQTSYWDFSDELIVFFLKYAFFKYADKIMKNMIFKKHV